MATFGKRSTVLATAALLATLALLAGCAGKTARMDVDSEDDALHMEPRAGNRLLPHLEPVHGTNDDDRRRSLV